MVAATAPPGRGGGVDSFS